MDGHHSLTSQVVFPQHFPYDFQEPELPKVDILVPAKTLANLVERKKATGMDDQEFFFEERLDQRRERDMGGKLATGLKNGALQKDFSVQLWGIQFVDVG